MLVIVFISFESIYFKLFTWLNFPSSDEMKMFYTENDFQADLENFEFNLKFHTERIRQAML